MSESIHEPHKPYEAIDIANFLIYLMVDSCDDLTNMKLNKILYYAQGHHLKKTGEPLFEDRIEAWTHGPVVKTVYSTYKSYSDNVISEYDPERIAVINDDDKSFLVDIAREYGRFTAGTLRNMTHKPKAPWSEVSEGEEITNERIKRYFIEHETEIKPLEIPFSEEDFIGYRDSEGILVLPEDWQDEEV